jgi:hypothetical protein
MRPVAGWSDNEEERSTLIKFYYCALFISLTNDCYGNVLRRLAQLAQDLGFKSFFPDSFEPIDAALRDAWRSRYLPGEAEKSFKVQGFKSSSLDRTN